MNTADETIDCFQIGSDDAHDVVEHYHAGQELGVPDVVLDALFL